MYPNTIEPIRSRRNTVQPKATPLSYWFRKCFFFLSLSLLALSSHALQASNTAANLSTNPTDTLAPASQPSSLISADQLASDMAIATIETAEETADRHPMERLRQLLLKNLVNDGLIHNTKTTTILHFTDDVHMINNTGVSMDLGHKYSAILSSYGIQSGKDVQVRVSKNFIVAGTFDEQGVLTDGQVRGVHPSAMVTN